ncbi:hypothetical protein FHG87_002027 [Trinorchestia longiramus]|nr:hypothetical protein FHG87_002027 [Trinorchestia longiramus]
MTLNMAVSAFARGFTRSSVRAGSNGLCRNHSVLSPELCRAFAVAPFKSAVHKMTHSPVDGQSNLLAPASSTQHSIVRSSSSGDHVKLWTAERVLSAVLLGAIPAAIVMPTPGVETFLALSLTVHSHWGIEALVHDYVRPAMFGDVIPKLSVAAVYALSVVTFGSLCYFIYTDVGLINAVSMLWKL